jgi:ABC-2 type transport system ATP-binding protein
MADRLVEKFEIDVKKKITKLSKGMLSMVTIIIALASKADITILDEPVAGLDVVAREYFYRLIIDEQLNTGRTFIVSTHIIEEAAGVFEEVIMLDKGRILLKENEQELLSHCVHISGREQDVDAATDGLKLYKVENIGRKKSATLLLNEGDEIKQGYDVTVQPISLQNLFVALCGEQ